MCSYSWIKTHGMHFKCILATKLRITKIQFTDYMKLTNKVDKSVDSSVLLWRGIKIPMGGDAETKCGTETKWWPFRHCPTWGFIPYGDTKPRHYYWWQEVLVTVAWYSCLLIGSARSCPIQLWMLTENHWTEKLEKRLKELKEFANL